MTENIEEQLKEIVTAYFIGLGYTVPPFNGMHSKEYFKQMQSLIDHIVLTEVIGKNEPETIEMGRRIFSVARNKLRASQRETYKALKGGK